LGCVVGTSYTCRPPCPHPHPACTAASIQPSPPTPPTHPTLSPPPPVVTLTGKLADAESMLALKDLANRLGSGNIWHEGGFPEMSGAYSRVKVPLVCFCVFNTCDLEAQVGGVACAAVFASPALYPPPPFPRLCPHTPVCPLTHPQPTSGPRMLPTAASLAWRQQTRSC
jgi:hypothetical protein